MQRNNRFKELIKKEEELLKINTPFENVLTLEESDFTEGELNQSGFFKLKESVTYLDLSEPITTVAPPKYKDGIKENLTKFAIRELKYIKKMKKR